MINSLKVRGACFESMPHFCYLASFYIMHFPSVSYKIDIMLEMNNRSFIFDVGGIMEVRNFSAIEPNSLKRQGW